MKKHTDAEVAAFLAILAGAAAAVLAGIRVTVKTDVRRL